MSIATNHFFVSQNNCLSRTFSKKFWTYFFFLRIILSSLGLCVIFSIPPLKHLEKSVSHLHHRNQGKFDFKQPSLLSKLSFYLLLFFERKKEKNNCDQPQPYFDLSISIFDKYFFLKLKV